MNAKPERYWRSISIPTDLWQRVVEEAARREPVPDMIGRLKPWSASAVICDAVRRMLEKEGV